MISEFGAVLVDADAAVELDSNEMISPIQLSFWDESLGDPGGRFEASITRLEKSGRRIGLDWIAEWLSM